MKKILLTVLITSIHINASAFMPGAIFVNINNKDVKAKLGGDEHLSWIETEQGDIIQYNNNNKRYEYLILENNKIKFSNSPIQNINNHNNINNSSRLPIIHRITKKEILKIWREKIQKDNNR